MGRIVVSENVSLDGVVQDPTGEEGFGRGGWFNRIDGEDFRQWAEVELDEARRAEALLLGRRTDAWFAERWLSRSGDWADRLNGLPKYVVSSTLEKPRWGSGTVLDGDVVDAVSELKRERDGEIVVYASRPLVRTLMEHGLVDELRLTVHPVVVGAGERLFDEPGDETCLRLLDTRTVGGGLAYLVYEVVREA